MSTQSSEVRTWDSPVRDAMSNILSTPYRPKPKTQLELERIDLFELFAELIEAEDAEQIAQWLESHGECA